MHIAVAIDGDSLGQVVAPLELSLRICVFVVISDPLAEYFDVRSPYREEAAGRNSPT